MAGRNKQLTRITRTAILTSLTCLLTLLVRIPTPTHGYVNLGDFAVILSGWMLGPLYGTLAGGLGSALADLISGYPVYIPATFIIKGLMSFTVSVLPFVTSGKERKRIRLCWAVSAVVAEAVMIAGYYLYEAVVIGLGFAPALAGIVGNVAQAVVGIVTSYFFIEAISHTTFCEKFDVNGFKTANKKQPESTEENRANDEEKNKAESGEK